MIFSRWVNRQTGRVSLRVLGGLPGLSTAPLPSNCTEIQMRIECVNASLAAGNFARLSDYAGIRQNPTGLTPRPEARSSTYHETVMITDNKASPCQAGSDGTSVTLNLTVHIHIPS